jgi:hypothetical protein
VDVRLRDRVSRGGMPCLVCNCSQARDIVLAKKLSQAWKE